MPDDIRQYVRDLEIRCTVLEKQVRTLVNPKPANLLSPALEKFLKSAAKADVHQGLTMGAVARCRGVARQARELLKQLPAHAATVSPAVPLPGADKRQVIPAEPLVGILESIKIDDLIWYQIRWPNGQVSWHAAEYIVREDGSSAACAKLGDRVKFAANW